MRPILLLGLAALLPTLLACEPEVVYSGSLMYEHLPLDAERTWRYANDSAEVAYELEVHKAESWSSSDEQNVYVFQHSDAATGDLLMEVGWSSDSLHGVLIHGYTVYDGPAGEGTSDSADTGGAGPVGDTVTYDPPVVFADPRMVPGDVETTETGGRTFTSTFHSSEACPNHWTQEWNDCLRIELDDGDGDDTAGSVVAGTYWLVTRYGIAWFERTGDADKWVLRDHDCVKGGVEC